MTYISWAEIGLVSDHITAMRNFEISTRNQLVVVTGRKGKGEEGEMRWREGFGPPKKFLCGTPMIIAIAACRRISEY